LLPVAHEVAMPEDAVSTRHAGLSMRVAKALNRIRTRTGLWRQSAERPSAPASASADVLQSVLSRRLIFLITTGRSGTEYLTHVLGLFENVHAEHEPEPSFTNAFRTIAAAPHVARQFWLEQKLPAIARSTAPVYAETSHLACKGFLESGIEIGLRPTLVHLVRGYRDTSRSMLALNTIPSRTYNGVRFYLGPDDRVFLPVERAVFEQWHDYQLCYWYCLEIGERARVYAERFGSVGIRVDRVMLDDLLTREGIEAFAQQLNLGALSNTGTRRLTALLGQRTNQKTNAKREHVLSDDQLEVWERAVETAIEPARLRNSAGRQNDGAGMQNVCV
jgi:hypothetical protein